MQLVGPASAHGRGSTDRCCELERKGSSLRRGRWPRCAECGRGERGRRRGRSAQVFERGYSAAQPHMQRSEGGARQGGVRRSELDRPDPPSRSGPSRDGGHRWGPRGPEAADTLASRVRDQELLHLHAEKEHLCGDRSLLGRDELPRCRRHGPRGGAWEQACTRLRRAARGLGGHSALTRPMGYARYPAAAAGSHGGMRACDRLRCPPREPGSGRGDARMQQGAASRCGPLRGDG